MAASNEPIFYKNNDSDTVWWVDFPDMLGRLAVSFDRVKILYLFEDYPWNFTPEERDAFERENPYWAEFFSNRPKTKPKG